MGQRVITTLAEPRTSGAVARLMGISPATASYHLGLLHRGGLVQRQRVGKQVIYSLTAKAAALSG